MILASAIITIILCETNFDKACDQAYENAVMLFRIDDDGHSRKVIGWDRSACSVEVMFESYKHNGGMGGHTHTYTFRAEANKYESTGA